MNWASYILLSIVLIIAYIGSLLSEETRQNLRTDKHLEDLQDPNQKSGEKGSNNQ